MGVASACLRPVPTPARHRGVTRCVSKLRIGAFSTSSARDRLRLGGADQRRVTGVERPSCRGPASSDRVAAPSTQVELSPARNA